MEYVRHGSVPGLPAAMERDAVPFLSSLGVSFRLVRAVKEPNQSIGGVPIYPRIHRFAKSANRICLQSKRLLYSST